MSSTKTTLFVCRSCALQNTQKDPSFQSEKILRETYEKKLKKGFFGKIAELRIVDCLTNCENPNSVMIDRENEELLLGNINEEKWVNEVVKLLKKLQDNSQPLQVSPALESRMVYKRPHRHWKASETPFHADRIRLPTVVSK